MNINIQIHVSVVAEHFGSVRPISDKKFETTDKSNDEFIKNSAKINLNSTYSGKDDMDECDFTFQQREGELDHLSTVSRQTTGHSRQAYTFITIWHVFDDGDQYIII